MTVEDQNNENIENNDMDNMVFTAEKIEFFPEDLKKMETMSRAEKTEFVAMLREEGRYTIVYE